MSKLRMYYQGSIHDLNIPDYTFGIANGAAFVNSPYIRVTSSNGQTSTSLLNGGRLFFKTQSRDSTITGLGCVGLTTNTQPYRSMPMIGSAYHFLDELIFYYNNKRHKIGIKPTFGYAVAYHTIDYDLYTSLAEDYYSFKSHGFSLATTSTGSMSTSGSKSSTSSIWSPSEEYHIYSTSSSSNSTVWNTASGSDTATSSIPTRTLTNATGSWVTSRTASAMSTTATWYTFSFTPLQSVQLTRNATRYYSYYSDAKNVTFSFRQVVTDVMSMSITRISQSHTNYVSATTNRNNHTASGYNQTVSEDQWATSHTKYPSFTRSTFSTQYINTPQAATYSSDAGVTQGGATSSGYAYTSSTYKFTSRTTNTTTYVYAGPINNNTRATYYMSFTGKHSRSYKDYPAPQAIQTVYITIPSYTYWTSSQRYSKETTYTTSSSATTFEIDGTWHNFTK